MPELTLADLPTPPKELTLSDLPTPKFGKPYNPVDDPTSGLYRNDADTTGLPWYQGNFFAGAGKGMADIVRGIEQATGHGSSRAEIDQIRARDQALMNTGAGKWGSVAGAGATMLPAAFIPGANTLAGAALIGAGSGALQPVGTNDSRLTNTAIGGAMGVGGYGVGKALQAGGAFLAPYIKSGRDKIIGALLQRTANDPDAIAAAAAGNSIPGYEATLAESTGDPGLATLQRGAAAANPETTNKILAARQLDQNQALISALQGMAGDDAKMAAAQEARRAATADLYHSATQANYPIDDQLSEMLQRPAMQQAVKRAQRIAANQGRPFSLSPSVEQNPVFAAGGQSPAMIGASKQITGQSLQDLKMAMDDLLEDPRSGIAGKEAGIVKDLRGQLLKWMEGRNPDFKAANSTYAEMSKPINQQQVAQALNDKLQPALNQFGANRMNANAYAAALRNAEQTVRNATGQPRLGLEDVMTPEQMTTLNDIGKALAARANAADLGRGAGSNTAQNLAVANLVNRAGIPTWAQKGAAAITDLLPIDLKPAWGSMNSSAEKLLQQRLAEALLDPRSAQQALLAATQQPGAINAAGNLVMRSLPATSTAGLINALQQ